MSESRLNFIEALDRKRPAFLAMLDQTVVGLRNNDDDWSSDRHHASILIGALMFSDRTMVHRQVLEAAPELNGQLTEDELVEAHTTLLSYLLSLLINENVRNRQELPPL